MTASTLYHTQGVRGFHYKKTERKNGVEYYHLVSAASQLPCPCCGSKDTKIVSTAELRSVRGLPVGLKKRYSRCMSGAFAAPAAERSRGNA